MNDSKFIFRAQKGSLQIISDLTFLDINIFIMHLDILCLDT